MISFKKYFHQLHSWLDSKGNGFLTLALIATAVFGILIALFGPVELKVILLAYWWLP